MNDPVIDLHMLFVSELGGTVRSFLKPHRCHRVVSLENTFILRPRKTMWYVRATKSQISLRIRAV